MSEVEAPDINRIAEWTDEEIQRYAESFKETAEHTTTRETQERKRERGARENDPRRRDGHGNILCGRCSKAVDAGLIYGSRTPKCDCRKRMNDARAAIERVDLSADMTFDALVDPHPSAADTAEKLQEIVSGDRTRGVFMFGLPGRGKSHLSVAAARGLLEKGVLVGVYSLAGLVSRIQDTYGYDDAAESRTKIVADVCANQVVILDDIGKEHRSSNVESIIYEIIDGLYRTKATLIASSNLPGKDFVERYDGAVLSRLGGMCEKVVIKGDDQRSKKWDW